METTEFLKRSGSIAIFGGGISGRSSAKLLKNKGKRIILIDKVPTGDVLFDEYFSETISMKELHDISTIVKSPGINPNHPLLKEAKEQGILIMGEIELGSLFFKGRIIGITGTDGKSTTTALTHHLIKKTFPDSRMGGNIGVPFTDFCEENSEFGILELSSYQLEDSPILNPFASAILNLAPDHLERHVTMENYLAAKRKIIPTSPDHTFITSNSLMDRIFPSGFRPGCKIRSFGTEKKTDAFISPETMEIVSNQSRYSTRSFRLKGEHNLHNLAAAILLAESAGCKPADIESEISGFSGLPYRFQLIRTLNGIQFINDSKSTNLHSMLSGVKGIGADTPIILILGGRPKKEELFPLEAALKSQNAVVFLFGEAVHSWENALGEMLGGKMVVKENLEEVVSSLPATIRDNKTRLVIFSPACASFDQYKNFEERGAHFTKLISELSL